MTTTRRELLKVLGTGAAVSACGMPIIGAVGCGPATPAGEGEGEGEGAAGEGEGEGEGQTGGTDTGVKKADVPAGLSVLAGHSVLLGSDAGGVYAMTSVCTHAGCTVPPSLTCPCHGSQYDENGNNTRGPAQLPLKHFLLTVDDSGELFIDLTQTVDAAVRV
jgi:Rieske Fe-S protein